MKKLGFLITMLVIASLPAWSQGAKSIRITEVMTHNRTNLVDEYGQHKPWVELSNSSFTTYNVRGMFLTTDRRVLNKNLSPEARRQLMCPLQRAPNHTGRQEEYRHLRQQFLVQRRLERTTLEGKGFFQHWSFPSQSDPTGKEAQLDSPL